MDISRAVCEEFASREPSFELQVDANILTVGTKEKVGHAFLEKLNLAKDDLEFRLHDEKAKLKEISNLSRNQKIQNRRDKIKNKNTPHRTPLNRRATP